MHDRLDAMRSIRRIIFPQLNFNLGFFTFIDDEKKGENKTFLIAKIIKIR